MSKFDKDKMRVEELMDYIAEGTDDRIYAIAQLMWLGVDHSRICDITHIDMFFLDKIKNIVRNNTMIKSSVSLIRGFLSFFILHLLQNNQKPMSHRVCGRSRK